LGEDAVAVLDGLHMSHVLLAVLPNVIDGAVEATVAIAMGQNNIGPIPLFWRAQVAPRRLVVPIDRPIILSKRLQAKPARLTHVLSPALIVRCARTSGQGIAVERITDRYPPT